MQYSLLLSVWSVWARLFRTRGITEGIIFNSGLLRYNPLPAAIPGAVDVSRRVWGWSESLICYPLPSLDIRGEWTDVPYSAAVYLEGFGGSFRYRGKRATDTCFLLHLPPLHNACNIKHNFFPCLSFLPWLQQPKRRRKLYNLLWEMEGDVLNPVTHRIPYPKMLPDYCRPKSEQFLNPHLCFIFKTLIFHLTHSAYLKVTFFPCLKTSKQFYPSQFQE